jgi:hypothetical protein
MALRFGFDDELHFITFTADVINGRNFQFSFHLHGNWLEVLEIKKSFERFNSDNLMLA